jgi:hypothetical protein
MMSYLWILKPHHYEQKANKQSLFYFFIQKSVDEKVQNPFNSAPLPR